MNLISNGTGQSQIAIPLFVWNELLAEYLHMPDQFLTTVLSLNLQMVESKLESKYREEFIRDRRIRQILPTIKRFYDAEKYGSADPDAARHELQRCQNLISAMTANMASGRPKRIKAL
jgi:hypothetical protein